MRVLNHRKQHLIAWIFLFVLAVIFTPSAAVAQDKDRSNGVIDLTKAVLFDPTTYAPAALSYTSQRMDWKTSQVLFDAGLVEHNSRFTVSGRPNDNPSASRQEIGRSGATR